jgi:hypothetical protein
MTFDSIDDKEKKARASVIRQAEHELKAAQELFKDKGIDFIEYSQLTVAITKKRDAELKTLADKVIADEKAERKKKLEAEVKGIEQ